MGFLEDKTAVIVYTGSVDFGVAAAFVEEGCNLVLVGRSISELETAKARLEVECGVKVLVAADASLGADDEAHAKGVIDRAAGKLGRIDVLVNCARTSVPDEDSAGAAERFDLAVYSGLYGVLHYMEACHPHLKETGGSVVNLVPSAFLPDGFGRYAYAAAKEGIRGLTRAVANDWLQDGVNVNAICPTALAAMPESLEDGRFELAAIEVGRGTGRAAARLASPEFKHLSGEILTLGGNVGPFLRA